MLMRNLKKFLMVNLIIFHAGSLSKPFEKLEQEFEKKYPGVDVKREASGSVTAARKITDLGRPCDVMASADYTVIENLLIPKFADWNINFATNEMAIMFTEDSKYSDVITENNWYEILLKEDVSYGHSDPNADPCGYRALLVWQLAEKFYGKEGLYNKLIAGCPLKNIRPKETDLLALLEAGEIDYVFIYKSVAIQHNKKFLELPPMISLKNKDEEYFYKQAEIQITGSKPGEMTTKNGEAMVYGITIPKNAPNYNMALKFVEFVLSPIGQKIMQDDGQEVIVPASSGQIDKIPAELKGVVVSEKK